jgi:amino acid adenylation domain-containing protein
VTASLGNLSDDQFALLLAGRKASAAVRRRADHALSPAQLEILVAEAINVSGSPAYSVGECCEIVGVLDLAALERAASELFVRHQLLRTTFQPAGADGIDGYRAVVHSAPRPALRVIDLRSLDAGGAELAATEAIGGLYASGLDPSRDPLARLTLIRVRDERSLLVVQAHHVAMDASSWSALLADLTDGYAAALDSREREPAGWQYADYIALVESRQRDGTQARHEAYWRAVLAEPPPPLTLPDSRRRSSPPTSAGRSYPVHLDAAVASRLGELADQWGVSKTILYFAAYAAALGRIANRADFVVGVLAADRPLEELDRVIGIFVHALPVRLKLGEHTCWPEFVRAAQDGYSGAAAHPLPLSQIAQIAGLPSEPDRRPVVQALFNSFSATSPAARQPDMPGAQLTFRQRPITTSEFDVALVLVENEAAARLQLIVNPDVVDEPVISSLLELTAQNLERLGTAPQARIRPAEQPAPRTADGGGGPAPAPGPPEPPGDPVAGFFGHARAGPEQVAIRWRDTVLSYGTVRDLVRSLAGRLRGLGVGAGDRVLIAAPTSPALVVATLATLSCGAVALAIDPQWPASYVRRALRDLPCRATVVTAGSPSQAPAAGTCVLAADGRLAGPASPAPVPVPEPTDREWPDVTPGGGYVVLTSGTTGQPKPVYLGLDALSHRLWWAQDAFPLASDDVVLLLAHPTFDFAYWEMLAPLAAGAGLAIPADAAHLGPRDIAAACDSHGVTVLHQVPSILELNFADPAFRRAAGRLRVLYVGGEALPADTARQLAACVPAVVNQYGPAEACIDVTAHRCGDDPYLRTLIGRPAPGVGVRILDSALRRVPRGSVGELWLAGPCLAYGYANAPGLTAGSFRPDPYARQPGGRMYRTGDLARELADGALDLLGRADDQLKISGVRIEPGETESVLLLHPGVRRAAAVLGADGAWRAYAEAAGVTTAELASHLRRHLPAYRLPAEVVIVASLPLLPSGKLDRRTLARTAGTGPAGGSAAEGRCSVTPAIAAAWAGALKLPLDTIHDEMDFFSSGGGSLTAMRLVAMLRDDGYSASVRAVFESPRLADFARHVVRSESS